MSALCRRNYIRRDDQTNVPNIVVPTKDFQGDANNGGISTGPCVLSGQGSNVIKGTQNGQSE